MVDWKFPIKPIRFTDDQMKRKKADYVAKHGYEISLPGITEIITLGNPREPDPGEFADWKKVDRAIYLIGKYPFSPARAKWEKEARITMAPARYNEITQIVERKRRRYRRMLASPTPTWMTNIASVMTWFDDVNDILGTAGVIFRTAAWLVPRFAKRFFLGPAGWLFLAADIFGILLNLTGSIMSAPLHCLNFKKHIEGVRGANPFSTESRQRRARKLKRFRPSWGELVEGLQVTDQVFGRGLCLGPILGAVYDIAFGTYRAVKGQRVSIRTLHPRLSDYETLAYKSTRELAALGLAEDELTEEDHFRVIMSAYLSQCAIRATILEWNPLDQIEGLEYMEIQADGPKHPTTIHVLEEFGIHPGEKIGWPFLDKEYASYDELWDTYREPLEKATMNYFIRNRYTEQGLVAAQNAKEAGLMCQSNIEGTNPLELVNIPAYQSLFNWTTAGCPCKTLGSMTMKPFMLDQGRSMQQGNVTIEWACNADIGASIFQYTTQAGELITLESSELCPGMESRRLPPGQIVGWKMLPANIVAARATMPLIDWLEGNRARDY